MKNKKYYWNLCKECGKELYPTAKMDGVYTVQKGTCPRCGKKDEWLTPTSDYRGVFD